ncbi:MAG: hypothetical protein ABEJ27_05095 [Halodesulfurarchaeum sp.]
MQRIAARVDTDQTPPLMIPVAHFVVATALLLGASAMAVVLLWSNGFHNPAATAVVHLLVAGWVGLTIKGAMIQFVPVWSGTNLRSRTLAVGTLWSATGGLLFLSAGLALGPRWLTLAGALLLLGGFWGFVGNLWLTLPPLREQDRTERFFLYALLSLLGGTVLGGLLVLTRLGLLALPVGYSNLYLAHLTVTVFGFVVLTVFGALFQLAPMFTQSPDTAIEVVTGELTVWFYPVGLVGFTAGRLLDSFQVAFAGGLWMLIGAGAFGVFFIHQLLVSRVEWGPMLHRYLVSALSLLAWTVISLPAWTAAPLSRGAKFGSPIAIPLLFVGAVGFLILGTLYHIVPFVVWLDRYSDRLGFEQVPAVDDLFSDQLAQVELLLLASGLLVLTLYLLVGAPSWIAATGGTALLAGLLVFTTNMAGVVRNHYPGALEDLRATLCFRTGKIE